MKRMKLAAKTVYTCPMHPEVVSDTAGVCPKCNMRLEPKQQFHEVDSGDTTATS